MPKGDKDIMTGKYLVNCVHFVECPLCYKCRRDVGGWSSKCDTCIAFGCHHDERHYSVTLTHRPQARIHGWHNA